MSANNSHGPLSNRIASSHTNTQSICDEPVKSNVTTHHVSRSGTPLTSYYTPICAFFILDKYFNSRNLAASRPNAQLFQILSDESNSDSIVWHPNGLAFTIHNRQKLVSEILPRCFGDEIQYISFTRKLKRWRFVRVSSSNGEATFYNKVRSIDCCLHVLECAN